MQNMRHFGLVNATHPINLWLSLCITLSITVPKTGDSTHPPPVQGRVCPLQVVSLSASVTPHGDWYDLSDNSRVSARCYPIILLYRSSFYMERWDKVSILGKDDMIQGILSVTESRNQDGLLFTYLLLSEGKFNKIKSLDYNHLN